MLAARHHARRRLGWGPRQRVPPSSPAPGCSPPSGRRGSARTKAICQRPIKHQTNQAGRNIPRGARCGGLPEMSVETMLWGVLVCTGGVGCVSPQWDELCSYQAEPLARLRRQWRSACATHNTAHESNEPLLHHFQYLIHLLPISTNQSCDDGAPGTSSWKAPPRICTPREPRAIRGSPAGLPVRADHAAL